MSLSPVNNACYAVLNKPVPPPKNNPGKASGSPIVAAALSLFGCSFFVPNRPASADAGPNDALQDTGDAATDCLCSDVIQSDINQTDVLPDGIRQGFGFVVAGDLDDELHWHLPSRN